MPFEKVSDLLLQGGSQMVSKLSKTPCQRCLHELQPKLQAWGTCGWSPEECGSLRGIPGLGGSASVSWILFGVSQYCLHKCHGTNNLKFSSESEISLNRYRYQIWYLYLEVATTWELSPCIAHWKLLKRNAMKSETIPEMCNEFQSCGPCPQTSLQLA